MTSQLNDVLCYFSELSCLMWIQFICSTYSWQFCFGFND